MYTIYTRCSSEEQSKGFSHDYQIEGLKRHQQIEDCAGVYSDTITGTIFERPQLELLYNVCKYDKSIKTILVYRWDRFGRNIVEALNYIKKFRELGVEVQCPENKVNYNDTNWPVMLGITFGIAQSESLKISDRTKDGMHSATAQGYLVTRCPTGYKREIKVSEGKRRSLLVLDETKAPLIKEMFLKVLKGYALAQIKREYGTLVNRSGKSFNLLFKNITYAGYLVVPSYKGQPSKIVKAKHEPIITLEIFRQVQEVLSKPSKVHASKANDSDIFYCKQLLIHFSQKKYTGYWSKGKNKKYPYYSVPGVKGSVLSASKIHTIVEDVMSNLGLIPEPYLSQAKQSLIDHLQSYFKNIPVLESELSKYKKRLEKLNNEFLEEQITSLQFTKLSSDLEKKIAEKEIELVHLVSSKKKQDQKIQELLNTIFNINNRFLNSDITRKSLILKSIFPKGFYIDETNTLRTPEINQVIEIMYKESDFYKKIKVEESIDSPTLDIKGG